MEYYLLAGLIEWSQLQHIFKPNMPFSHHSHSGQFCGHAENTLDEVVRTALSKQMGLYALTEHMPREEEDLYPEEVAKHSESKYSRAYAVLPDRIILYCGNAGEAI